MHTCLKALFTCQITATCVYCLTKGLEPFMGKVLLPSTNGVLSWALNTQILYDQS